MAKYRMRPIVFDAFQMVKEMRYDSGDWPVWLHKAWKIFNQEVNSVFPANLFHSDLGDKLMIRTKEGLKVIEWDDYIVLFPDGNLSISSPKEFESLCDLISE